ncbi:MAG: hypothetical protein JW828_04925 [Sedimentisphaerales bacterium]|nr:hypothetical protein [Sedimentisphaerales bacterium]
MRKWMNLCFIVEILVELGLEIRQKAALDNLIIISLNNDVIGYVRHRRAYEQGGYERGPGTHLAKGAGETMVSEALDILAEIRQN